MTRTTSDRTDDLSEVSHVLENGSSLSWKSLGSIFPYLTSILRTVVILIENDRSPRTYSVSQKTYPKYSTPYTSSSRHRLRRACCKDVPQRDHPSPALARGKLDRASPSPRCGHSLATNYPQTWWVGDFSRGILLVECRSDVRRRDKNSFSSNLSLWQGKMRNEASCTEVSAGQR